MAKLLQLSIKDAQRIFGELETAITTANLDDISESSHALKSVAAQVGALKVQNLARQLEGMGKMAALAEATATFKALEPAFQDFMAYLNKAMYRQETHM